MRSACMRRLLCATLSATMLATAVALTATAFAADQAAAPAAPQPPARAHLLPAGCRTAYTASQHRRYARRVFHRIHITRHARRRLAVMRHCRRRGRHARAGARRIERRLARRRARHMCTQTRVVNCIRDATRIYGGSFAHHLACAISESRLNPYARNAGGSAATGIFQFLPSTFSATLRRMHVGAKSIYSAKWNSRAAVWKFAHDGYGEWTGAGC